MQTTKNLILARIKRSGGSTVEELATALGLARMTVRQHLAALQRDGLLTSREVRRPTGRPHYLFTLSEKGEELFPKRYDRLAELLLQSVADLESGDIAGLNPEEKRELILMKAVSRVLEEHAAKLENKPLAGRVATVVAILQEEGGFAEWRQIEQGYEISDYNCVYRKVVESHQEVCHWHRTLLNQLLGQEVRCQQLMSDGAESCRFFVDGR
jgi:predicted ArsR family transcriptional regulator